MPHTVPLIEGDPLWYQDAVIYELHIKAFYDSNGDGIGDFKGLTQKLDYLERLGITAVWLLPFYPSPLRDDGYDTAYYFDVHPNYGTLRDFKEFLREANKRGIRVITELVLNHTSDQHPWFQRARKAEYGSVWRNFYVWSDTHERYKDARIIFKDFETANWTWDHVANAYYWHRFYSHQPDLNYDNPQVQKAMFQVIDNWFEMGVDGLRLDAVPYLFEREGTNCENLPETYDFLKKLRAHIDGKFKNKMLLAEANQWPEDAAAYFGDGDECHMAFHFPVMPRLFMSMWMEDRYPIIDIFEQTPTIPDTCQWALFLRNHDELTLEMVTDEERDYMYRVYARDPNARINLGIRRRLAPLLNNHRGKIEVMNMLLFSLPGTPIIYYGDEIGMGDNFYLGDRNGVRTPMQWSTDRNAGFSRTNPQKLYLPAIIDPEYHYEAINVENQEGNHASLLWWTRRIVDMRKRFKAFGRGSIEFLLPDNPKVLAFIRQYADETILVVVNLSRYAQVVEIDLSRFAGYVPEEVFSRNRFPVIRETPYVLTLNFNDYFWFQLKQEEHVIPVGELQRLIPELSVSGSWEQALQGRMKEFIEANILPPFLELCRWYGGKARKMREVNIVENIPLGRGTAAAHLLFVKVGYIEGLPDTYLLPLSFAVGETALKIMETRPQIILARLQCSDGEGVLYDSSHDEEFRKNLYGMILKRSGARGLQGQLIAYPGRYLRSLKDKETLHEKSQVLKAEQSNTSILYGNELFLKLYRRLDEGINPDLELGRFLTEQASFPHVPPFAGAIEYRDTGAEPVIVGILQAFLPNQGDAWTYSLDAAGRYFERVLARMNEIKEMPRTSSSLLDLATQDTPPLFEELIGGVYLETASLLGMRTGELHRALSRDTEDPNFSPEPFTLLYQRSLYQSIQSLTKRVFDLLRKNLKKLPDHVREEAGAAAQMEKDIIHRLKRIFTRKISAMKTRHHGDYHLGQVLYTGNDFYIIDFEGEPARSLSERRLKKSPLRDVAGMIRSFHYGAYTALLKHIPFRPEDIQTLGPWAELWYKYVSGAFLRAYLHTVKESQLIPRDADELNIMLNAYLLEKAVYEIGYELNNRPDWLMIPLRGVRQLLEE